MSSTNALFSPGIRADGWIAISGQVGVEPESGELAVGVFAQTRQALRNLRAVLEENGAGIESLVKVNVFLTDMAGYEAMNDAYREAFAGLRMPARTALAVAGLPRGAQVEIEAWARATVVASSR